MLENVFNTAEQGIADIERNAKGLQSIVRQLKSSASQGNLSYMRQYLEEFERKLTGIKESLTRIHETLSFDESAYLASGSFVKEIIAKGPEEGVRLIERDGVVYCPPVRITVKPSEQAIYIDKKKLISLRPSLLLRKMKELQRSPSQFSPASFIEALHEGYKYVLAERRSRIGQASDVLLLVDIYKVLTLLPGNGRKYSRQDFSSDIYLLDRSGVRETKSGFRMELASSSGSRIHSDTLRVIDHEGEERVYFGITFQISESR